MALKSTIFKAEVQVTDLDRNYYASHGLTLARHPSETDERMMVRLLAFVLFASDALEFGKGISDESEPDLWQKDLTGEVELWIELGQPDERDIRRACGRARQVVLVTYGGAPADVWWSKISGKLAKLDNLRVINLVPAETQAMAGLVERTMSLQATIQDGAVMLAGDAGLVEIHPVLLKEAGR